MQKYFSIFFLVQAVFFSSAISSFGNGSAYICKSIAVSRHYASGKAENFGTMTFNLRATRDRITWSMSGSENTLDATESPFVFSDGVFQVAIFNDNLKPTRFSYVSSYKEFSDSIKAVCREF